jgi:hypothetical protein
MQNEQPLVRIEHQAVESRERLPVGASADKSYTPHLRKTLEMEMMVVR